MTNSVLIVSNRRPKDPGGRAEKIASRVSVLSELGWECVIGHVPEPYVTGFPFRLASVVRAGSDAGVDIVLSINNPFHLHVHGLLSSRVLGVPWVAEFRDPILARPNLERGDLRWYPARVVEWATARFADRIIWLDGIQLPDTYFEATYPNRPASRFVKVPPMGYDREKFAAAEARTYDSFTITYAGSFYEDWIEPDAFLEGLGAWLSDAHPDVRVQFYGDWAPDYQRTAERIGVADVIEHHEFVPHEEIIPVLKGSDVLLFIGGTDPENARNLPSKIFDYIGSRTPILAVVDPSFRVAKLIEDHGLGIAVSPGNPSAIAAALSRLYAGPFEYAPETDIHDRYTRRASTTEIAAVLEAVLEEANA